MPDLKRRHRRHRLRIHRRGFYRDGTFIPPKNFMAEDQGKIGREPKSSLIKVEHPGLLKGWEHNRPAEVRRTHLKRAINSAGPLLVWRGLRGLAARSTRTSPHTNRVATEDAGWVMREHRQSIHTALARER